MSRTGDIRYSYQDVPTLKRFAESNARIRGILGPFRSGKSSASVMEIARRGVTQAPFEGVRRTRFLVVRNCYDDQTEILTERRGWQFFADLTPEDKVATLRYGTLTFETPSYHYAAHYEGEMIGLKSQGVDLLVTPDHHLWASKRTNPGRVWGEHKHVKASDIYGMELFRFRRDADWAGNDPGYSPDFFEFLGFWFAEGSAGEYYYPDRKAPHWRFNVVQKETGYVRDLLTRAGLKWGENVSAESGCTYFRIVVTDDLKPLVRELASLGGAVTKHVPQWIKDAAADWAAAFIHGYIQGDGTYKAGRKNKVTYAATSSKRLADDLQEIALRAGLVGNIGVRVTKARVGSHRPTTSVSYTVTFLTPKRAQPWTKGWYKQPYNGMVYCLEVSTHVVYVRRGGKGVWCGQTYSELKDSTMRTVMMWLPPERFGDWHASDHNYTIKGLQGEGDAKTEIEIWFRALDRPDHVAKLLSVEVTGAWVNEAKEVPWTVIDAIDGRIGQYPPKMMGGPSWIGMWLDTNPPDVDSKWYKFFEETVHDPRVVEIFRQPSGLSAIAENLSNLPRRTYYKDLVASGKDQAYIDVFVHGKYGFVNTGKAIYPEFIEAAHKRDLEPVRGTVITRGWDGGLTPSCVFMQDMPDGRFLVFDEMVSDNMSVDQFSDDVMLHCARSFPADTKFEDVGDPAMQGRGEQRAESSFDILHAKGIAIEGGPQDPAIRWESVKWLLRQKMPGSFEPRFAIHSRCRVLIKGFLGAYGRKRMMVAGAERFSDQADKNEYSHPHDALQYPVAKIFGPIITQRARDEHEDDWNDYADTHAGASQSATGY